MIMLPVLLSFLYVFLLIFQLCRVQFFFLYLPHVFIYTEPVKFHLDQGPKNTLSCTSAKCANGTFCPAFFFFPLHEHSHPHYFPGTVSGDGLGSLLRLDLFVHVIKGLINIVTQSLYSDRPIK
jgi:hypothetical protein